MTKPNQPVYQESECEESDENVQKQEREPNPIQVKLTIKKPDTVDV